jgi:hypothetical protein
LPHEGSLLSLEMRIPGSRQNRRVNRRLNQNCATLGRERMAGQIQTGYHARNDDNVARSDPPIIALSHPLNDDVRKFRQFSQVKRVQAAGIPKHTVIDVCP